MFGATFRATADTGTRILNWCFRCPLLSCHTLPTDAFPEQGNRGVLGAWAVDFISDFCDPQEPQGKAVGGLCN